MSVKLIRMVSGEEVLAEMITPFSLMEGDTSPIESQFSHIGVKNPAILIPAGQGKLALVPWLPYAKTEGMQITTKAIAFIVEPQVELANEYHSMFGSGLVVPTNSLTRPKLTIAGD